LPGFRLGPFELLGPDGLDVAHPVMESIYRSTTRSRAIAPRPHRPARRRGLLGPNRASGFYRYEEGKKKEIPDHRRRRKAKTVWISPIDWASIIEMRCQSGGGDRQRHPPGDSLCLVAPVGDDATTIAIDQELDPARTVAVDCLFGLDKRRT